MTDPNPSDPIAPALPGLDPPAAPVSALERAVERTLSALEADGLLVERHAAIAELCRTMARTVAIGVLSRRSTGAAMAAAELRQALAMLPEREAGAGDTDAWDALAAELAKASDHADG